MNRLITLTIVALSLPATAQVLEVCTPGATPPREGLACLPHVVDGRAEWVLDQAQILNARAGDAPLSAGCGFIGKLLTQVRPAQLYGHTGIMTLDRYAIRHSTGSDSRIQAYPIGELAHLGEPTDGFRSDVMRWGWPGTISQSVQNAYEGEYLTDPDNGQSFRIDAFNQNIDENCDLQTPPAVMMPPPDEEADDPTVRTRLKAAAAAAENIRGHYRFYNYTDGTQFEEAPAEAGWAAGTLPTVCSTFVRAAARAAGIHLEGQLEPEDCIVPEGADEAPVQVDPDAACAPGQSTANPEHDGMYFYHAAERTAAAHWLHGEVHAKALKKAGGGGQAFYDVPDDIADLFTNCFAFDWCGPADEGVRHIDDSSIVFTCIQNEEDAKDSNCWEAPGVGRTTSPDDMLRWDAPRDGGAYGHKETLQYREPRYFVRHRWQEADGFGRVQAVVMNAQGLQYSGAEVRVAGIPGFTEDGTAEIVGVPPGTHPITACKALDDGQYVSATGEVQVVAGETAQVQLIAQLSADCESDPPVTWWTREVSFGGTITITDDEFWTSNEVETFQVPLQTTILHPLTGLDRHTFRFEACAGDEVTAVIEAFVELDPATGQPVIDTQLKVTLKEGGSCDDQSVEKRATFGTDVTPGVTAFFNEHVVSDEWDSNDTIDLLIHVTNTHPVWGDAQPGL